ncbi:MAG: TonB-dependent receptor [Sphingomonas bacterium]|uniref:TonB-dependent receptor n=1 Tax=Sphingomonas bacterium TaxID=1895847 RepID=UPI00262A5593|nr:TonB-dependent receptor [Sphingomonas bacterium]MDB5704086.1 TonB-dependent receptor [Sphingomonas bacterium]
MKRKSVVFLFQGVMLSALLVHPAAAQTTDPQAAAGTPATTEAGPAATDTSGDIIVTATKRSEQASRVPISMVALSQRDLDRAGIKTLSDLAAVTPGLLFTEQNVNGAPVANFTIRGIESRTSAPTTSIYLDDIPLLTIAENFDLGAASATPQAFDLDRVEALRGPQGTLFGNSAEGGSVRFILTAPSLTDYHVYARAEGAVTDSGGPSGEFGVAVGGPIESGTLGFRASASIRRDGGYVDRVRPVIGGPGNGGVLDKDANWSTVKTGRIALLYAPTSWLTIQPSFYIQEAHQNDTGRYEVAISNPGNGNLNNAANAALPSTDRFWVAELKMEADLGGVTLTSITGYDKRDYAFTGDFLNYQDFQLLGSPYAQFPGETGVGYYRDQQNSETQEIRLASNDPQARLTWVVGAYYNNLHQHDNGATIHDEVRPVIAQLAALGYIPGQYYLNKYNYYGDVVFDVRNLALFGNADYKLTDTLKLSVGLRGSKTRTMTTNDVEGAFTGHQFNSGSATETAVTPKFTLAWQKDSSNLFYASVGKGYRNGGVNTITTTSAPACVAFQQANNLVVKPTYQPDSLWSYEVGAKSSFLNGRIRANASAYHIDWSNIQTSAQLGPCSFAAIFNLGSAKVNGFDLAVRGQLSEQANLGISLGYTNGKYNQSSSGVVTRGDQIGGPGFAGNPATPPWVVAVDGQYDVPIHDGKTLYFWVQDVYRSRNPGPFSSLNPANFIAYNPGVVGDPATNTFNARIGLIVGKFNVSAFANNLFNAHPQLSLADSQAGDPRFYAYTPRPRTFGLNVTFRD